MRLKGLHHVQFEVRDLDLQEKFCADFGLVTSERTADRLITRTQGGDVGACPGSARW